MTDCATAEDLAHADGPLRWLRSANVVSTVKLLTQARWGKATVRGVHWWLAADSSSVRHEVGARYETVPVERVGQDHEREGMPDLDHDVVVQMAPKSVTPIRTQVKYVRKAEPLVVEPTDT